MSLTGLCRSTGTISRPTYSADNYGGQVASFATAYTLYNLLIQPASGRITEEFAKRGLQVSHVAYTPTEVAILAGDKLVSGGVTYLIQSWGDEAGQGRVWKLYLLRKD